MPVPAFAELGKATKELLAGGRAGGAFQFDPKVSYSSTTSTGVSFTASAVQKGDKVDPSLKAAYATKKWSVDAAYDASGKVAINGAVAEVAPGLKLGGSLVLPDPSTAKVAVEYNMPYLNVKSTVGLTSAPVVEGSASTGYKNFLLGGEAAYDTSKSLITKWSVGAGYHASDYQVAAVLADKGNTLKLLYAHQVTPTQTVGAEVARQLASTDTAFSLGYSRKLSNGALTKFKLDQAGALSMLYETRLASGEKVAASVLMSATDLTRPVKYGFALDFF